MNKILRRPEGGLAQNDSIRGGCMNKILRRPKCGLAQNDSFILTGSLGNCVLRCPNNLHPCRDRNDRLN
jgi:hypothetical protein